MNRLTLTIILTSISILGFGQGNWKFSSGKYFDSITDTPLTGAKHIEFNKVEGDIVFDNGLVQSCTFSYKNQENEDPHDMNSMEFHQLAEYFWKGWFTTDKITSITPNNTFYSDNGYYLFWNIKIESPTVQVKMMDLEGQQLLDKKSRSSYFYFNSSTIDGLMQNDQIYFLDIIKNDNKGFRMTFDLRQLNRLDPTNSATLNSELEKLTGEKSSDEYLFKKAQLFLKYNCHSEAFVIYKKMIDDAINPLNYKLKLWLEYIKSNN